MIDQVKENAINDGNVALTNIIDPCCTTVSNYTAVLAQTNTISIDSSKAIAKINTRFTAENSLIASMIYSVAVAYSHYIPVESADNRTLKDISNAPTGVRVMYNMVSKALGVPIIPVKPCYIYSSDDTVVYTFEGKGEKEQKFRLVSKSAYKSAGHTAKYKIDNNVQNDGSQSKDDIYLFCHRYGSTNIHHCLWDE